MILASILKWIVAKVMPILNSMGIGADKSYDMIAPSLPDLQKPDFTGMYREYQEIKQKSETLQRQPVEQLFDTNYMVESDMPRGRRYMIQYKFEVRDMDTGVISTEFRNVYEMDRNTLKGWRDSGENYFEAVFEKYNLELVSTQVNNVFHKIGWKY